MDVPVDDLARRWPPMLKELFEVPGYRVRIKAYHQEWQS